MSATTENISYNEKLKSIAERFDMTEAQTIEFIVNELYNSNCLSAGLTKALKLLENYDEFDDSYNHNKFTLDGAKSLLYEAINILEGLNSEPPF